MSINRRYVLDISNYNLDENLRKRLWDYVRMWDDVSNGSFKSFYWDDKDEFPEIAAYIKEEADKLGFDPEKEEVLILIDW